MEVKVYKRGIIVIPSEVRKKLNIQEGSILEVQIIGDKIVLQPKMSLLNAHGIDEKELGLRLIKELEEEKRD
ncbi:MAG: AbrB/MazE/SpoVT family DNA-binding domain-containing protein [Sulfolobus sp.]|nr:AbrB/MazE/SpoVT family DNA-binding domain-containing protein [Sulfolobus sp.]